MSHPTHRVSQGAESAFTADTQSPGRTPPPESSSDISETSRTSLELHTHDVSRTTASPPTQSRVQQPTSFCTSGSGSDSLEPATVIATDDVPVRAETVDTSVLGRGETGVTAGVEAAEAAALPPHPAASDSGFGRRQSSRRSVGPSGARAATGSSEALGTRVDSRGSALTPRRTDSSSSARRRSGESFRDPYGADTESRKQSVRDPLDVGSRRSSRDDGAAGGGSRRRSIRDPFDVGSRESSRDADGAPDAHNARRQSVRDPLDVGSRRSSRDDGAAGGGSRRRSIRDPFDVGLRESNRDADGAGGGGSQTQSFRDPPGDVGGSRRSSKDADGAPGMDRRRSERSELTASQRSTSFGSRTAARAAQRERSTGATDTAEAVLSGSQRKASAGSEGLLRRGSSRASAGFVAVSERPRKVSATVVDSADGPSADQDVPLEATAAPSVHKPVALFTTGSPSHRSSSTSKGESEQREVTRGDHAAASASAFQRLSPTLPAESTSPRAAFERGPPEPVSPHKMRASIGSVLALRTDGGEAAEGSDQTVVTVDGDTGAELRFFAGQGGIVCVTRPVDGGDASPPTAFRVLVYQPPNRLVWPDAGGGCTLPPNRARHRATLTALRRLAESSGVAHNFGAEDIGVSPRNSRQAGGCGQYNLDTPAASELGERGRLAAQDAAREPWSPPGRRKERGFGHVEAPLRAGEGRLAGVAGKLMEWEARHRKQREQKEEARRQQAAAASTNSPVRRPKFDSTPRRPSPASRTGSGFGTPPPLPSRRVQSRGSTPVKSRVMDWCDEQNRSSSPPVAVRSWMTSIALRRFPLGVSSLRSSVSSPRPATLRASWTQSATSRTNSPQKVARTSSPVTGWQARRPSPRYESPAGNGVRSSPGGHRRRRPSPRPPRRREGREGDTAERCERSSPPPRTVADLRVHTGPSELSKLRAENEDLLRALEQLRLKNVHSKSLRLRVSAPETALTAPAHGGKSPFRRTVLSLATECELPTGVDRHPPVSSPSASARTGPATGYWDKFPEASGNGHLPH